MRWHFQTPKDREPFFNKVKEATGVDLLACQGVPPRRWLISRASRRMVCAERGFRRSISYRHMSDVHKSMRYKSPIESRDEIPGSSSHMSPVKSRAEFHQNSHYKSPVKPSRAEVVGSSRHKSPKKIHAENGGSVRHSENTMEFNPFNNSYLTQKVGFAIHFQLSIN